MTDSAAAFCPGHISGYFKRVARKSALLTGSTGAGIVITEGVLATVRPSAETVIEIHRMNKRGLNEVIANDSPLLRSALDLLSVRAEVRTTCRLPIGAGFGLSAAALLATLTAVNRLYRLNLTEKRIAHIAHETELRHRTGLGDVTACRGGGMVIRTIPGIDAPVKRLLGFDGPVFAVSLGPIPTPSVLSSKEQMERISAACPDHEPEGIDDFFSISQEFARSSGLVTDDVRKILDACREHNIPASMTMLGNGVFAYGDDAQNILSRFGRVYTMAVAKTGPRIITEDR